VIGRAVVHVRQDGTAKTYCGEPLLFGTHLPWELAKRSTCSDCRAHFG
jgi:hypothetical protein